MAKVTEAVGGEENLPNPVEAPTDVTFVTVDKLWQDVVRIQMGYEEATKQLQPRQQRLEQAEAELAHQRQELTERIDDHAGWAAEIEKELGERRTTFDRREERLAQLELRLVKQEEDAKAHAAVAVREALAEARAQLDTERKQIRERAVQLQALQEDVEDKRQLAAQRQEREIATATEQTRLRLEALERRHKDLLADQERLQEVRREYERFKRALLPYGPEQAVKELNRLQQENNDLRNQQAPAQLTADIHRLREAEQMWKEDRAYFMAENEKLQRELTAYQITALELSRQELVKKALLSDIEAYKDEVEHLRGDLEGLKRRKEGESPFPGCSAMDEKHKQERDDLADDLLPLPEFIHDMRHFIAQQQGLFYAESDLRIFLAGLAATRLHLLQGVSGIGKTQLPLAFAKAMRAKAVVVPVGADWRTPQDLIGYYNAFERRFYESPFTQAVYRANCPEFRAQPLFVVLDEMNLSHPEQYFSEMLSALEIKGPAALDLTTAAVYPAPRWLRDGRQLPLPLNVWFIGTANQDETTVGFAEKTFDRSNVLELPSRPTRFVPEPTEPLPPFSSKALHQAFDAAEAAHAKSAQDVAAFLDGELRTRLGRDFRISAGPRTMAQLARFVPVVRAAGGTLREAADHVLAMKVLRKVRGQYEFKVRTIEALRDDLPKFWTALPKAKDDSDIPVRSIQLLEEELHRRGGM